MTTLSRLIRKRADRDFATAIPAIPATQQTPSAGTVAKIATVAVAKPAQEEPQPAGTVAKIATVAVANSPNPEAERRTVARVATVAVASATRPVIEPSWVSISYIRGWAVTGAELRCYKERLARLECKTGPDSDDAERWALAEILAARPGDDQVTCGDCQHFQSDTIGDGTGIGGCAAGVMTGPLKYPSVKRHCEQWRMRA